jgi:hypothetical protein
MLKHGIRPRAKASTIKLGDDEDKDDSVQPETDHEFSGHHLKHLTKAPKARKPKIAVSLYRLRLVT